MIAGMPPALPVAELAAASLLELGLVLGALTGVWLLSLALRDASIVDIAWGAGFVLVAWTSGAQAGQLEARPLLCALLVSVWGLRLAGYLLWRNWGAGEDVRYVRMRRHWGARFPLVSLFTVFWLQGALMWIVSLPVQLVMLQGGQAPLGPLDALAVVGFALGLAFEGIGDWQLARFKADPANRGHVMDRGLWSWTRHPNYFGDTVMWWSLFLLALPLPWGIATAVGPAVMNYFLVRVSGKAMLERGLSRSKPGWADYAARTSGFVPWPPRRPG
jgi:steroid 5-alpha reductase family enzyme